MDLWQLNIFCKVVELKSFSRAGKQIRLSQPTISSHIKDLEAHFNCRLIDRLSKEAAPTQAGELLYQYARRMLQLKEETESAISEYLGVLRGRIVVGGSTIPGVYLLPRVMGAFRRAYPAVEVALLIGDTASVVEDVVSRRVELGVVGARLPDKQIDQEEVGGDDLCLAVSRSHPWAGRKSVSLAEIAGQPFIIREAGSGTLRTFEQSLKLVKRSLDDLEIVAEMGSTAAVIQGIRSGVGISVVSRLAGEDAERGGGIHLLNLQEITIRRSFYLTTLTQRTASPLARAFIHFFKKNANALSIQNQNQIALKTP